MKTKMILLDLWTSTVYSLHRQFEWCNMLDRVDSKYRASTAPDLLRLCVRKDASFSLASRGWFSGFCLEVL